MVDDEQTILFAMREYLKAFDYQVDCVTEREQAQRSIEQGAYQAVVLDLRLTGMDGKEGLEMVSFIRERSPSTRIVVLTAYGSPEVETEAMIRGADLFLHKPTRMQEVNEKLLSLISPN